MHFTIVGAGPGDPDLITLKAFRAIKRSDIVFVDSLVSKDFVEKIDQSRKIMNIGRRSGDMGNDPIRNLREKLLEISNKSIDVCHLKNGDPGLFGRLQEEIKLLEEFRINYDIIPGITSAIGIPTMLGIPVTARGVSRAVTLLTATNEYGHFAENEIANSLRTPTTTIILMVRNFISNLSELLLREGFKGAVTVIQNGTLPNEKVITFDYATSNKVIKVDESTDPTIVVIQPAKKQ
ncbi:MAG: SAM-dependent methyltransferase [Thermoplasmatales archaeon]